MNDNSTKQTLESALGQIVGYVLSSVTFVMDYVQLAFDGPALTAYTLPMISLETGTLKWVQPGYRDALCAQIGRRVERTSVDRDHVAIVFSGGAAISISLRDEDYCGPEALEFSLDKDRKWVA